MFSECKNIRRRHRRYLKEELKAIVTSDKEADTQPTAGFQRVVQRA